MKKPRADVQKLRSIDKERIMKARRMAMLERAEGPFHIREIEKRQILMVGEEDVCDWLRSYSFTRYLNSGLSFWLKSPAGERWMKKEKIV